MFCAFTFILICALSNLLDLIISYLSFSVQFSSTIYTSLRASHPSEDSTSSLLFVHFSLHPECIHVWICFSSDWSPWITEALEQFFFLPMLNYYVKVFCFFLFLLSSNTWVEWVEMYLSQSSPLPSMKRQ